VLAYYRPNRGIGAEDTKKVKPPAYPQLAAYHRALDAQVGPFQGFVRWLRLEEDRENEARLRKDPSHRDRRLQAVRDAIERFLSALSPGTFSNLRVVRRADVDTGAELPAEILIDKGNISLSLDNLSDGERSMLLLVADLAMRLVVANPGAEEPLRGRGIVLIDEVELHLHPAWQRAAMPGLTEVFPNLQIIATTHSPQVLSTLTPESVVILENGRRVEATPPTYGRDTNALLRDVMHTPPRPEEAAEKLSRIARLIDAEDFGKARAALDDLSTWLGDPQEAPRPLRSNATLKRARIPTPSPGSPT
jgi:predicted ATP-binding protein involved in virulence